MFEENNPRDARTMSVGQYGFQGDVVIKKIERIPEFDTMQAENTTMCLQKEK